MEKDKTYPTFFHTHMRARFERFKGELIERECGMAEEEAKQALQFFLTCFVLYNGLLKDTKGQGDTLYVKDKASMNFSSVLLRDVFNELGYDYKAVRDSAKDAGVFKLLRKGWHDPMLGFGQCARYEIGLKTLKIGPPGCNKFLDKLIQNAERKKNAQSVKMVEGQRDVITDPCTRIDLDADDLKELNDEERSIVRIINDGVADSYPFKEKMGRIYHPFQRLPDWVREQIRIHGEPVKELDLKNSQAVVLFRVVRDYYQKWSACVPKDVQMGLELAEKGVLYEHIMYITDVNDRDRAKKLFNKAVFGEKKESGGDLSNWGRFLCKEVRERFPSVFNWMDSRKSSSHRDVHNLLTREEARLIRSAQERLYDVDVPFLNVHDAVYVRERDADFARECLEDLDFSVNEAACEYHPYDWGVHAPGDLVAKRAYMVQKVKEKNKVEKLEQDTSVLGRLRRGEDVGSELEERFEQEGRRECEDAGVMEVVS